MAEKLDRRRLLGTSVGALAGAGIAGLSVPAAVAQERGTELPPVPGMFGDRLANEMWYVFDDVTLFHRLPEVHEALVAMQTALGDGPVTKILNNWTEMNRTPEYPGNFTDYVAPVREPLRTLSRVQLGVFDTYYRPHSPGLVAAFADFGQGLLYDPRRAEYESEVHMMNGSPTAGYHIWHAILRAMIFLGVDRDRWTAIDPLVGFAWALQSVARPHPRQVNPPLPRVNVRKMAATWLPRTPTQLDVAFRAYPYPESAH
ncbi:hypothetical protein [Streptomyces milbemycinicus]|uniref:Secreted protein n=1 Tax=Streptomyces milbemycinicus TaxID=476552 RepID=A0ABW8LVS4_9ACTN